MNATVIIKHSSSSRPELKVAIAASGNLEAILPDGRTLELSKNPLQSIYTILFAQANGELRMGTKGAPTRHQIWHMEQHAQFADSRCTFCRREGRTTKTRADFRKQAAAAKASTIMGLDMF